MKLRQVLPLTALVVAVFASGCSSQSDEQPQDAPDFETPKAVSLRPESVKANQHFANTVSVEDGRLVVTMDASNEQMMSTVKVGSIIAGNRDTATADLTASKNPYGFLRRVTGISRSGNQAVLTTTPAALEDWMEEGDIFMGDGQRSIFDDQDPSAPATQNLHILGGSAAGGAQPGSSEEASLEGSDTTDATKKIKVRPFAKVSNTKWALNAKYDGEFKLRKAWFVPTGVSRAKALLTMDPTVSADIEIGVRVTGGGTAIGGANGYPVASMQKTWSGKSIVIPVDAGIPVTIRFEPQLKCGVSLQGSASVKFRAELQVHAAAGFLYDGSFHDLSQAPKINPSFLHPVSGKVELDGTAECDLLMVPAVLAFDAVGLEGKVGPYVSLNVNACALYDATTSKASVGVDAYEQHGLYGEFDARVQVPVIGVGKDFGLVSWHGLKSNPAYFIGNASTCNVQSKDSCAGKADGFYCSELVSYAGQYCKGGTIAGGFQCSDVQKKCKSGSSTGIVCQ